jgi:hypothetical protein
MGEDGEYIELTGRDENFTAADQYLRTGSTGMSDEKQLVDMILLTYKNACMYTAFAPNGKTRCP